MNTPFTFDGVLFVRCSFCLLNSLFGEEGGENIKIFCCGCFDLFLSSRWMQGKVSLRLKYLPHVCMYACLWWVAPNHFSTGQTCSYGHTTGKYICQMYKSKRSFFNPDWNPMAQRICVYLMNQITFTQKMYKIWNINCTKSQLI